MNIVSLGYPKLGQVRSIEFIPQFVSAHAIVAVKGDQFFAFLLVWDSRHYARSGANYRVDNFLDLHVRDHFPADLTEPRHAVRDGYEAVFVQGRDITGDIPTIAEHLFGEVRLAEITEHNVGSRGYEQPFMPGRQSVPRVGIDHLNGDTRDRVPDRAGFVTYLPFC